MGVRFTWSYIARVNSDLEKHNLLLQDLFQRHLGDGSDIKFWQENWSGNGTLAEKWPRLAALDSNRNCSMADRCVPSTNGNPFRGCWRRALREGRELNDARELADFCSSFNIGFGESRWSWGLCNSGKFSVASLRKSIDDLALKRGTHVVLSNKCIPSKVRIFCWKARLDRLPTKTNLRQRGSDIPDDQCVLCNNSNETADHLFLSVGKHGRRGRRCSTIVDYYRLTYRTWENSSIGWETAINRRRSNAREKLSELRIYGEYGLEGMIVSSTTKTSYL
ncbi:hypothetical protein OSB04_023480 [Centaurea solstitialis]|uniref:Reverse transcriptase zinc-binding domain-containing protein n=1 Tax=Centaurea solstitialis TaxID=347529 RepID=A0AA38T3W8_9ASTR|nr:hypothetical protein OSB04_023480 [Centaurea solstitialis]